jgi:sugar/nucleoside kinase (ribokinase family)
VPEVVGHRPEVQVFGTVFFDLVFPDLPSPPRPGAEIRTPHLGLSPGGSANIAVALARLGLLPRLSAPFADDAFGHYLSESLEHEGVDLSGSSCLESWTTPLTVSLAYQRERALITYEEPAVAPPAAWANGADERPADACYLPLAGGEQPWLERARRRYRFIFADVGWDQAERWGGSLLKELTLTDVFLPNAAEAMAYTLSGSPREAAATLSQYVPLAVVKCGDRGAVAAGEGLDRPLWVEALPTEAVDTTGAGDVFDAAFIYGTLERWPVEQRLRFANLCAGQSVRYPGGSLSAPCWRDLEAWWEGEVDPAVRASYSWLPDLLESRQLGQTCQRPCASLPWRQASENSHTK